MEGASTSSEGLHMVDDFYHSVLYGDEEIISISDEKYAEDLQLQEALYYSTVSSARVENKVADDDEPLKKLKRKQKEKGETSKTSSRAFCGICMDAKPGEQMFRNQNCSHLYCDHCIQGHVAAKIQENISMVKCPEPRCKAVIEPENCRSIIPKEVFDRWENALCENMVLASQKFYCPFKDCSAMMICDASEVVTSSECPHCNRLFCAQCKVSWHAGLDCKEFKRSKREKRENGDSLVTNLAKKKGWRRCSKCKIYVERIHGCTRISCRFVLYMLSTL